MYIYSFEKLEVWKLSKSVCVDIYQLTNKFPSEERFGMVAQMRRASISIASNISEGSSRMTSKDQAHFYTMPYSSAIELLNQLIISEALFFIYSQDLIQARLNLEPITRGISKLREFALNPKL
jgi:four helix bundle protein